MMVVIRVLTRRLVAIAALGLALAVGLSDAEAGHQMVAGQYHCSSSPKLCRATWTTPNTEVNIRVIDQYSGSAPYLTTAVNNAVASWFLSGGGPIRARTSAYPNDSFAYMKIGTSAGPYLTPSDVGITRLCVSSCTTLVGVYNIVWSETYLNLSILTNAYVQTSGGAFKAQWTAAHELGHSVGLDHHPRGGCPGYNIWTSVLMRPCADEGPGVNGPVGWDIGTLTNPPCQGTDGQLGVRCIYRWSLN